MQFGKQNAWTTWWYSRPFLIVLVLAVVLLFISVLERYRVEREMAARTEASVRELEELTKRQGELKTRVEYLEGERGVEEEIRKNFDVARVGEQVIILTGEPAAPEPAAPAAVPVDAPWYIFWR
jgi:cell division protein FtsB